MRAASGTAAGGCSGGPACECCETGNDVTTAPDARWRQKQQNDMCFHAIFQNSKKKTLQQYQNKVFRFVASGDDICPQDDLRSRSI